MRRRHIIVAGAVVVAIASGAIAWSLEDGSASSGSPAEDPVAAEDDATTATVARGTLTRDHEYTGDVTYGDSWALPLQPDGVVTSARPAGTVVGFGEELLRVDNRPVFLAEGPIPMYRELAHQAEEMSGYDVTFLQMFLISAGFDDGGEMAATGEFDAHTRDAVKDWQKSIGIEQTGRVTPSDIVFSPAPLRIDSVPRVGTRFDLIEMTEATPTITVDADNDERKGLEVGRPVEIELADGTVLSGSVADQQRVIEADGSVVWRTAFDVTGTIGGDESSVLVRSTVVEADEVLIVPVSALLAVADGGFALELVEAEGRRLVPVEIGVVIDGRAAVTGEIGEGDQVVVPV
jgi:peptidoglycan hydrolase-like protein with peptidoglycan-binding domain